MLKLIVRAFLVLLGATAIANAAETSQTGRVTFVDPAANQLLVDNQLVELNGDLTGMDIRLGDEVALVFNGDAVTAILEPAITGAITNDEPLPSDTERTIAGLITFFDSEAGMLVLDNTLSMTVDGAGLGTFQVGEAVVAHFTAADGANIATALSTIE